MCKFTNPHEQSYADLRDGYITTAWYIWWVDGMYLFIFEGTEEVELFGITLWMNFKPL
jgi:hypothetical protein